MLDPELFRMRADEAFDHAVRNRRHLHRHPELSFEERETARYVCAELDALGVEHTPGVGGNGVVATIRGSGDHMVGLRADMDALPIRELNDHGFRSENDGVMHACGHDGHTSSLLATARVLASLGSELPGAVRLIFQPAEERAPGGAKAMIDAGVLERPRVERVFGQHVNTELPAGSVGFKTGLFMASADEVYITVHGRGGHAAKPHQGADPVVIASTLVVALQQLVSRNADPTVPSVLTFGRFVGDGAANVIPDAVELAGTFRTVDESWRESALVRLEEAARSIASGLGGSAEVRLVRGYPAVVNDAETTRIARELAVAYLGDEHVVDLPTAMWAEDFAYFARERPSCFYNLGVRNEERGIVHGVHTPRFDLDEEALRVGSGLMAWIAVGALERLTGDRR